MKYYTLRFFTTSCKEGTTDCINCNSILSLFPNKTIDEEISGEEIINTILDSGTRYGFDIYRNKHLLTPITKDTIGDSAYARLMEYLGLENSDFQTMNGVYNAKDSSYCAVCKNIEDCHWSKNVRNSKHVLFSDSVADKNYVVFDKQVGRDYYLSVYRTYISNVRASDFGEAIDAKVSKLKQDFCKRYLNG